MILRALLFSFNLLVVFSARPGVYVHFDLKGAPPKVDYFLQLLSIINKLGADGIVIEWEDMFPFSGELEEIRNGNAYSEEDVTTILDYANGLGLKTIPLVQTLGHMEWLLKTEKFARFREDQRYPQVVCIGNEKAQQIVLEIVNQILAIHSKFPLPFFHIGADEIYQIGICDEDKLKLDQKYNNDTKELMMDHIRLVASNITSQSETTTVLAWFDIFKDSSVETIKKYSLNEMIVPTVWKYTEHLDKDLPLDMWQSLSKSFKRIWGGSAFKGAAGANKFWNPVKPYVQNNRQWFLQSVRYSELFENFEGIILTGWQRYDHFASLCELFPVSMNSLAINIKILQRFVLVDNDVEEILHALSCPNETTIDDLIAGNDTCRFTGYQIRNAISNLKKQKDYYDNAGWLKTREMGWLQTSQMLVSASNMWNLESVANQYSNILKSLNSAIKILKSNMKQFFFDDVLEEFMADYIVPFYSDIKTKSDSIARISGRSSFEPRPWFKT